MRYEYRQPRRHRFIHHKPPRFADTRKDYSRRKPEIARQRLQLLETCEDHLRKFLSQRTEHRLLRSTTNQHHPPCVISSQRSVCGIRFKQSRQVFLWRKTADKEKITFREAETSP